MTKVISLTSLNVAIEMLESQLNASNAILTSSQTDESLSRAYAKGYNDATIEALKQVKCLLMDIKEINE
jgi:hypothetical protein